MADQEETPTEEEDEAQGAESSDEASAGEDAPEAEAGADEELDAEAGAQEATEAADTPPPSQDEGVAAAQEHLAGVDLERDREAVEKITKELDT